MSVEPNAAHQQSTAEPFSSFTSSTAFISMKAGWSAMPQRTKLILAAAVAVFVLFAAVIGVSVVGSVASRIVGSGSTLKAQVASADDNPAAQMCNEKIAGLKVTTDVDGGTVRVRFTLKGSPEGGPVAGGRFLVRLFDRSGQFLDVAQSERLVEMYGVNPTIYWDDRDVDVQFSSNAVVLKEAKMAEVGFSFD